MAETVNGYTETDLGNVAPNPRGDYSETGEYEYLDLVAYAGGSYICIKEDGTISGTAPTPGKTTEIWQEASRPGDLTPEYVAMHDDVVNKAASSATDAAQVAADREQVEGMKENVASLQEQTAQDTQLTKEYRESAAGYASAAETSRTAAGESEENVRALVNGFDAHVEEQKTSAQEEITTSRQAAIKAIAAQQVSSVNAVKQEGQNAIDKTNADAEATAADRAAVAEKAATVDGQAAQVAQNAAQVAEDKATAENYMQTAGESKKQALEAAERLKDSVNLVQKNTVDLLEKAPVIIGSATSYDGTPVEVNDSAEMHLQGLRLYGKSKQVTTTGANLFDANDVSKGYVSDDSGSNIVVANSYCSNFIAVSAKTKYYLYSGQDGGRWGAFYDSSKTFILEIGPDKYNSVFETPENAAYVRFTVNYNNNNPDFARNVIFAKSTVALPFEPYTGGKPSPSPDYPQEIVSVGQKLSTGKNLINADDYYSAYKQADGTYVSSLSAINEIKVGLGTFVGKQITISVEATKPSTITYLMIAAMINNTRVTSEQMWGNGVIKITVTPVLSTDYFWISYGSGSGEISISDIQVEYGSEATSYEPYIGGVPTLYQKGIEVRVTGKNLFDLSKEYTSGTTANAFTFTLKPSTKYTLSTDFPKTANVASIYFGGPSSDTNGVWKDRPKTFATDSSGNIAVYIRTIKQDNAPAIFNDILNGVYHIQLEEGNTATSYEPYKQSQSLPITTPTGLPAIPVPSGTSGITYTDTDGQAWIADEIDFSRGKYVQRVWQAEFDGSEDEVWKTADNEKPFRIEKAMPEDMYYRTGFCNRYKSTISFINTGVIFGINNTAIYMSDSGFYDKTLPDRGLSKLKAYLAEHPLKVMTYLDTPIETDLSEAQIQAYKSLTTFKPTSIISNDENAQMEVEYACDTKTYIDNKLQEIAQALVASASEAE